MNYDDFLIFRQDSGLDNIVDHILHENAKNNFDTG